MLELLRFVRSRTWWLVATPFLLAAGLVLHELCHAATVVALGGSLLEVRLVPSIADGQLLLGRVLHDGVADPRWVAITPLLVSLTLASGAAALTSRMRDLELASKLSFVFVVLPLVDVSLAIGGYVLRRPGDLAIATSSLGPWVWPATQVVALLGLAGFGTLAYHRYRAANPTELSSRQFGAAFCALMLVPWTLLL